MGAIALAVAAWFFGWVVFPEPKFMRDLWVRLGWAKPSEPAPTTTTTNRRI
jgi:hypothetical protein